MALSTPHHSDLGLVPRRNQTKFIELDLAVGAQTKLLVPAVTMAFAGSQYLRGRVSAHSIQAQTGSLQVELIRRRHQFIHETYCDVICTRGQKGTSQCSNFHVLLDILTRFDGYLCHVFGWLGCLLVVVWVFVTDLRSA